MNPNRFELLMEGSSTLLAPQQTRIEGVSKMADWKKQARTTVAGLLMAGMTSGVAFGFPEGGDKSKNDFSAVLEKVPPEIREKVKAEFEKIRAESEKVKAQATEAQKQASAKMEQIERSWHERASKLAKYGQSEAAKIEQSALKIIEREKERNKELQAELDRVKKENKSRLGESLEERRDIAVEVHNAREGEPKVQIVENGKPVSSTTVDFRGPVNLRLAAPQPEDLSKLPPEKREAIEKVLKEFKEAEARFKAANEKLAKVEGREQPSKVSIFTTENGPDDVVVPGQPNIQMRFGQRGDRLPGMPLPPGVIVRGDRLPASPELEKRVSKAEKALDDILDELKKLREADEADDDDDVKAAKQKPKK